MVYRIYVEKKEELAVEAASLCADIRTLLRIDTLSAVRILNRYDCENITPELFNSCRSTVFSEPQLDLTYDALPEDNNAVVFAAEYLPGQFDQRADSAAQCIQIISKGERPLVRTAKVYMLYGGIDGEQLSAIKKYVINPVEAREAALDKPRTLETEYDIPQTVATVDGFTALDRAGLDDLRVKLGFAMDSDDIVFCRDYFAGEKRDPTITELRMIDTYWSDHCRHTTFLTEIDNIRFEDETTQAAYKRYLDARAELGRTKLVCLMDIATLAAKVLKKQGKLDRLDESEEINACTVKIDVDVDGETQKWLLLFKNETHNHPTEIEPFGGAATCIGGAIRDPLSGRAYVYAAMRVTGAANPTVPVSQTLEGKLPQRKIVTTAAAGYSSYGNQIGLATGIVDELYHPGYAAKRMEIGAVIAAAPEANVRRERPAPGDIVILLGGRTGRDGCGGATGSSKSHSVASLESCGAEVQKGNAPEERKLQRLFRNSEASRLIKRCNDFGAGGVSVAIGELADGIEIDLNAVPKKYNGLDGTELAISESQERMAVVTAPGDVARFCEIAAAENLEATVVATVTEKPRLRMSWNGRDIVDVSREFLDSNGAPKHIDINAARAVCPQRKISGSFAENITAIAGDLNCASKRGLSERFDSTIGAGSVLMPFGGKYQRTPVQAMVNKISLPDADTQTVSLMAWGANPYITEASPYHGAYLAVVESVSKLISSGAQFKDVYLTFQEYFEKPAHDPDRWGKPASALLGAFSAQLDLGIAAIGGKDSMSGSFEKLDVPPTLVSFAVTTSNIGDIVSPEFKEAGHKVYLIRPEYREDGLPDAKSLKRVFDTVTALVRSGKAKAVCTPGFGGIAESVMKMCMGNRVGFAFDASVEADDIFGYLYGSFIVESVTELDAQLLGETVPQLALSYKNESVTLDDITQKYENALEGVFTCNNVEPSDRVKDFSYSTSSHTKAAVSCAKPRVLIPVFPGTNCEYDSAKAVARAGAVPEIVVINNLSASGVASSVEHFASRIKQAQVIFIPGGFSGGDEPDGSGKFITAFFRSGAVAEATMQLLGQRDGLMCGICNGFQALIKLGLVPYGKIIETDADCPTLTFNTIGRHQSKLVRTRIASNNSPWLAATKPGEVYTVPVSHGEGRFIASDELVAELARKGQIATQYCDFSGHASADIDFNPNGSAWAIEGITSPDGRVIGKMGHSERVGKGLYKNVPGVYDMGMFDSMVEYYR